MEKHIKTILAASGGSVLALLTLVLNLFVNVQKDAQIALDVAKQHGQELLEIRAEISLLRSDLRENTRDRYHREEAERDMAFLERRIEALEER